MKCVFNVQRSWPKAHEDTKRETWEREHAAKELAQYIGEATADGRRYAVQQHAHEHMGEDFGVPVVVHTRSALVVLSDHDQANIGEMVASRWLDNLDSGSGTVVVDMDGERWRFVQRRFGFAGRVMSHVWERVS